MKKYIIYIPILCLAFFNVQGQDEQKNSFFLEIGRGGGDGISESNIYGLHYMRSLKNGLDGYVKYNFSKGNRTSDYFSDVYETENHSGDAIPTRYSQYYSLGIGASFKVVNTSSSNLYLLAGLRLLKSKRTNLSSTLFSAYDPPVIQEIEITSDLHFGHEIGIGYRKMVFDEFTVGGEIGYAATQSRMSVSLMMGIKF